jgi:hypothetical protein
VARVAVGLIVEVFDVKIFRGVFVSGCAARLARVPGASQTF